jgi:outer membrane lipoprotein-sorting protein
MLRLVARISCFFALMLAASFVLAQAEFSAEVVDTQKSASNQAKIYFAKDKVRIESQGKGSQGGGAIIVNYATQTSVILMPQQHMYMETAAKSANQKMGFGSALFATGDVENACGDWQKTQNQGGSCHKVGADSVNGRSTVKYESTNSSGDVSHFWLDPKLRFPVKWEGKSSSGELRNIQEGAQPASLFEIPSGFMDLGSMKLH